VIRPVQILAIAALAGCGADVIELGAVAYDARHGDATTMKVFLPAEPRPDGPAIVMIHGGGWRYFSNEVYADHAARFAAAGYAVAAINYRLVPDGAYPAMIQDCACALAFFRSRSAEYGFDPDRVALIGYSAGAHLASLIGVAIDEPAFAPDCDTGATGPPAAVISGAGPQDMRAMPEVDAVTDFLGGTAEEVPEIYDLASPLFHVGDEPEVPFLFVHGEHDLFVGLSHSERMRDALIAAGGEARLLALPGGGHIVNPAPDLGHAAIAVSATDEPVAWAAILAFLDDVVGAP
jgi:acetyl esterase/lipase